MSFVQGAVQKDGVRVRGVRRGAYAEEHGQSALRAAHEGNQKNQHSRPSIPLPIQSSQPFHNEIARMSLKKHEKRIFF